MKASTTTQPVLGGGLGDPGAGPGGQLAGGGRGGVQDRGDGGEREPEAVVQHEGHPLPRRQPVQHHLQGQPHGVGEGDLVGRVGHRVRHVLQLLDGHRGAGLEPVQAQPRGDRRQPGRQVQHLGLRAVQPQPGLLHDVLGLRPVTEHPRGQGGQPGPLRLELLDHLHSLLTTRPHGV
jgi:hypothetical protein